MAAKKTTSTTRNVRTKTEVLQEFQSLPLETKNVDSKTAAIAQKREADLLQSVGNLTVDKAVSAVTKVNLEVSRALSEVQQNLAERVQELQDVSEAVELKKKELEELHQIDVAQTALNILVEDYQARKKSFAMDQEAVRLAWEEERAAHEKAAREFEAETRKAREREQADYAYKTKLERQRAEDEFAATMMRTRREEADRATALAKDWKVREEALAAREAEFKALQAKVDGMQSVIDEAVKKAEAIVKNAVTREYENKIALAQKDSESDKKVFEFKIAQLNADLEHKNAEIENLRRQVEAANQRVTDIATKAFESTSGQIALEKMTGVIGSATSRNGSNPKV